MKFVKSLPILFPIIASTGITGLASDDAETLIQVYVEAVGGKAAIDQVHTQVTKGTFALPDMGIYAPFEMYVEPPDKSFMVINFSEVSPASNGVNGDVAWQDNPMTGPQILTGESRRSALRSVAIEPLLRWKQYFAKAELSGEETINGQPCSKVVFTADEGDALVVYFDNETHLIARMIGEQGGMRTQTDLSDYRAVGSLKQPFRLSMVSPQFSFKIEVESIEHNLPIEPAKFALPPAIQSQVGK